MIHYDTRVGPQTGDSCLRQTLNEKLLSRASEMIHPLSVKTHFSLPLEHSSMSGGRSDYHIPTHTTGSQLYTVVQAERSSQGCVILFKLLVFGNHGSKDPETTWSLVPLDSFASFQGNGRSWHGNIISLWRLVATDLSPGVQVHGTGELCKPDSVPGPFRNRVEAQQSLPSGIVFLGDLALKTGLLLFGKSNDVVPLDEGVGLAVEGVSVFISLVELGEAAEIEGVVGWERHGYRYRATTAFQGPPAVLINNFPIITTSP